MYLLQKMTKEEAIIEAKAYTNRTGRVAHVVHFKHGFEDIDSEEFFKTYRKRKIYFTTPKPNLNRKISKRDMKLVDNFIKEYKKW